MTLGQVKTKSIRHKKDTLDFIKIKYFYIFERHRKMKKQAIYLEKTVTKHILHSEYKKNFSTQ